MLNLIQNEWIKIFKQIGTYIMIGLVVLLVIGNGAITKYLDSKAEPVDQDWKQELTISNQQHAANMETMPMTKEFFKQQIAINEYRIEHDLAPEYTTTVWTFIQDSASFISFAGLFVIIIAAGIVANEFTWGTVKVLLIKPFHRWKILMAKYTTVILFLLLVLGVLFVSAAAIGAILFGTGGEASNVHLAYVKGTVVEQSLLLYLIKSYLLNSLSIFLLATMAFMISAVFRVSGLAIGISIFLLMMGGTVTQLLAMKFDWAKYSLFANTNLMQYADGSPLVEGMTMSFSITMMLIYFFIFHLLAFIFFTKRDVAT
ncbi:ABC transporter permease [Bacillus sp. FJAT-50079]|uniref:ABC transporter permease n=1 Tax=Bacillus sp. FJAT-50079 TaxID=2833577 RepID=UPI001BC90517|nr:ABC transporter permease [Bacillus sp. FJAT-50079]MBS4209285.1 ABC transporter permease [Bacillus sp. FJAT-50079]